MRAAASGAAVATCHKEVAFDWARMSDTRGDTGPYLQYMHARLLSIEQQAEDGRLPPAGDVDVALLPEAEAAQLGE